MIFTQKHFLCSAFPLYTVHFISLVVHFIVLHAIHWCHQPYIGCCKFTIYPQNDTSNIIPAPKSIWYIFEWIRKKFFGRSKTIKKEHMKTIRVSLSLFSFVLSSIHSLILGVIIILLKQSFDANRIWCVNITRQMKPSYIRPSGSHFSEKFPLTLYSCYRKPAQPNLFDNKKKERRSIK